MKKEDRLHLYREMVRIRRLEEMVKDLFASMEILGSVHLYIGEEAVAAGACAALRPDDYLTSTHRGHGHVLAKGADPGKMLAELLGRVTGYNKARGGSMHLAAPELGILGANGIVGGGLPLAVGAAMSAQKLKNGRVTLCFFGDGASNEGTFHEALNIAASYQLPVVFICENNLYAGGVKQHYDGVYRNEGMDYPRKVEYVADRARAYDMPGAVVDGNDVEQVREQVEEAVRRAREGNGPTLLECRTYRWRTHFEVEPDTYRDPGEVEAWKAKCPILTYGKRLIEEGDAAQEDLDQIGREVDAEMQAALAFARSSPEPELSTALDDVYAV